MIIFSYIFHLKITYLNDPNRRIYRHLLGNLLKKLKEVHMKLTINYKIRASKVLNFSIEEIEEYSKRLKGHLNKCIKNNNDILTTNQIIQSIFIIKDIQDKQIQREAKELQVQNPIIRKYQHDIKLMSHNGLGSNRIEKELRIKHQVNVSASTIYRYLKSENNE